MVKTEQNVSLSRHQLPLHTALLGTFLCGLPASHTDDSAARRPEPHLQEWPDVAKRVEPHTHTHTLSLSPLPLPSPHSLSPTFAPNSCSIPAPGNCKGSFWRWSAPSRVQSRVAAKSQQPALGLPSPGNARGPKLAGQLSVPRKAWLAPRHCHRSAKRWTDLTCCSQQCQGYGSQCWPAHPGKGRGLSTPGSQQVILLWMELPPAELASFAGAPQRGHWFQRGESPTRAPSQLPPPPRR